MSNNIKSFSERFRQAQYLIGDLRADICNVGSREFKEEVDIKLLGRRLGKMTSELSLLACEFDNLTSHNKKLKIVSANSGIDGLIDKVNEIIVRINEAKNNVM